MNPKEKYGRLNLLIRTKSSAYNRYDISLSFNLGGSHVESKIDGKSLIYKENNVGLKIHPCFTPTEELKKSVIPSEIFTEYKTSLYISFIILKKGPSML